MNLLENVTIHTGDALLVLKKLDSESVHCVVTSPPYWRLRDYDVEGQLGLEPTPEEYIRNLVRVFKQVRRVLKPNGTCWVNMGDSYAGNGGAYGNEKSTLQGTKHSMAGGARRALKSGAGLKRKDLVGIPWMLAFAMRKDGWSWRDEIIWRKTNGMPSSTKDRTTRVHEVVLMFSKSATYYYDQDAIKEPANGERDARRNRWDRDGRTPPGQKPQKREGRSSGNLARVYDVNPSAPHRARNVPWEGSMRNRRSVWDIATDNYEGEHYAVFPPDLVVPCVLAGCPESGVVLDPFGGTGTLGGVAVAHSRAAILIDLKPAHVSQMPARIEQVVRELRQAPAPPRLHESQGRLFDPHGGDVNVLETKN